MRILTPVDSYECLSKHSPNPPHTTAPTRRPSSGHSSNRIASLRTTPILESDASNENESSSSTTSAAQFEFETFVPVPLVSSAARRPASAATTPVPRSYRTPGPAKGRITPLIRTTLFPGGDSDDGGEDQDGGGTSGEIGSGGPSTSASMSVGLLRHGLSQILATKDSARRYIEHLRKKMFQYMVLNKEYTNTHVLDQLRNKGISSLKKTLTSRLEQLNILSKTLQRHPNSDSEGSQQQRQQQQQQGVIESMKEELFELRTNHHASEQACRDLRRSLEEERLSWEKSLQQQHEEYQHKMERARDEEHLERIRIESMLEQMKQEKRNLQEQVESLEMELSQHKLEVHRLRSVAGTTERTAGGEEENASSMASSEHVARLEFALSNACNEVDRLSSECEAQRSTIDDARVDIARLVQAYKRLNRNHTRMKSVQQSHLDEVVELKRRLKEAALECDESRDLQEAYEQGYESIRFEKLKLETSFQQVLEDFENLRIHLCELMIEQLQTIPLPLEAIETNPELTIMLCTAAAAAGESEEEEQGNHLGDGEGENTIERIISGSTPNSANRTKSVIGGAIRSPSSIGNSSLRTQPASSIMDDSTSNAMDLSSVLRRLSLDNSPVSRASSISSLRSDNRSVSRSSGDGSMIGGGLSTSSVQSESRLIGRSYGTPTLRGDSRTNLSDSIESIHHTPSSLISSRSPLKTTSTVPIATAETTRLANSNSTSPLGLRLLTQPSTAMRTTSSRLAGRSLMHAFEENADELRQRLKC